MKKFIRFVSLLVLLCVCLSGCSYLDELRTNRATIVEDDIIRLYDGTEYKLLPEIEYFSPFNSSLGSTTTIYVVDEDVPLLLSELYGYWGYKSHNGQFIERDFGSFTQCYCRTDIYDSIIARSSSGFIPEVYAYSYYDHKTNSGQFYTLTAQQAEALEAVLATQEPYQLPSNAKLDYLYSVRLYQSSRDFLFQKYAVLIFYNEGKYYLRDTDSLIYDVPQELNLVFDAIMEKELNG